MNIDESNRTKVTRAMAAFYIAFGWCAVIGPAIGVAYGTVWALADGVTWTGVTPMLEFLGSHVLGMVYPVLWIPLMVVIPLIAFSAYKSDNSFRSS